MTNCICSRICRPVLPCLTLAFRLFGDVNVSSDLKIHGEYKYQVLYPESAVTGHYDSIPWIPGDLTYTGRSGKNVSSLKDWSFVHSLTS